MSSRSGTVIKSEAMLVSDLFYQGRYVVPWHQRYYDWKPSDVKALLHDVDNAISESRDCYFLGAIILVEAGADQWEINDGQQRMVTLSLMCAALCRRFAEEAVGSQREGFTLRVLFDMREDNVATLADSAQYTPRITPPQNDSMRYRQIIRGNSIGANGTLTDAWKVIEEFFTSKDIEQLNKYSDFLLRKVEVACLNVPSSVDPNAVYETINCRGKQLDDLDLIRNYLYSCFNASEDHERKSQVHDGLERIRIMITNAQRASEYMRCYLQCKFGFLAKDHFYRDAREAISNQKNRRSNKLLPMSGYVFGLVEEVAARENLQLFHIITTTSPDPDFVQAFKRASGTIRSSRNITVYLRELRGYKVTQPLVFAILMQYMRNPQDRAIAKLANKNLRRLAAFVMRTAFVAPKFEPSHFETEFSNYAKDITAGSHMPDGEFADFLKECDRREHGVLDDRKFEFDLLEARMTGTTKIKQFLLGINRGLQPDAEMLNEYVCTIEHILPKSPQHWSNWIYFKDVSPNEWVDRIGNLTLMGPSDNRPGSKFNGDFSEKKEIYQRSGIALTRELTTHHIWSPDDIEVRQREMVQSAIKVWRFE